MFTARSAPSTTPADALGIDVDRPPSDATRRLLLAGVLLLALLLRLHRVDQPLIDAFSWREASTAMMAHNFLHTRANIFFPEVSWTGPGPSYQGREFQTFSFLVATIWRVTGQHEWVGRATAALFGVLGVVSMYALVRRIWDEPRALASALVLAILPGAIFIDRSFLPDPAMLGITLCGAWLCVRAAQTGRSVWLGAGVLALGMLTKLPGAIFLPAVVYAATRGNARLPSRWVRLAALATIVLSLWAYYRWALHLGRSYPPYHVAGAGNWISWEALPQWLAKGYYLDPTIGNLTYWLWTVPICALVLIGLLVRPPRTRDAGVADARWFFHWLLLGGVLFYLVGARELVENLWNYHVFNAVAAAFAGHALVLVATASFEAGRRLPSPMVMAARVAVIVALTLGFRAFYLQGFYDSGNKVDSLLLGRALDRWAGADDLVATIADDVGDPISIYYSRRRGWVYPQATRPDLWHAWSAFPEDPELSVALFEDLRQGGARWIGIVGRPRDDPRGERDFWSRQAPVMAHIERTCEAVERSPNYTVYRILSSDELAARAQPTPAVAARDDDPEPAEEAADELPMGEVEPDAIVQ